MAQFIPVGVQGPGLRFTGDLVDVSSTGILIRCPNEVPEGRVVRLGIGFGQKTARVVAVARRTVPAIGVAFEFSNMGQSDRELIHRLILKLQSALIPTRS